MVVVVDVRKVNRVTPIFWRLSCFELTVIADLFEVIFGPDVDAPGVLSDFAQGLHGFFVAGISKHF